MSGRTPQQALDNLARTALRTRFGGHRPPRRYKKAARPRTPARREDGLAPYFLTVNSIVLLCAQPGHPLPGPRLGRQLRLICFVLGITSIDPIKHTLLFERFISGARDEPPDIDVDFEHERREDVIQWIYRTYAGPCRADRRGQPLPRPRRRPRVGKALGFPRTSPPRSPAQVWGWSQEGVEERHAADSISTRPSRAWP
jgi:error-prone DNA polymerase